MWETRQTPSKRQLSTQSWQKFKARRVKTDAYSYWATRNKWRKCWKIRTLVSQGDFSLATQSHFEDFDDQELRQILELKLKKQGLEATEEAKDVAIGLLSRARDRPNFGNAGDVENLISHAKAQEQKRRSMQTVKSQKAEVLFLPQDFDENFDRANNATLNLRKLFADVVGCETLIGKLERYQRVAANMRARGMDPKSHIPFNFIFKGPPGESL